MSSITLKNVFLDIPVYGMNSRSLKNAMIGLGSAGRIGGASKNENVVVHALSDISFQADNGDRIALIGSNGSGKSTLLRVLAGIYEPNQGYISIQGKTVPLLAIDLGIEEEVSGRENIFLRGMMLDFSRAEIEQFVDSIIEFTELGAYIDLPVRTYSAGMRMRLAFAISITVEPEILLMDEWILAGDAGFLGKAQDRILEMVKKASIVILATHNLGIIRTVCNRAIVLFHGEIQYIGDVETGIETYLKQLE